MQDTTGEKRILHVVEIKVRISFAPCLRQVKGRNRAQRWRCGVAQAVLYLAQGHEAHGTPDGTFILETSFARLHASGRTIHLEVRAGCEAEEAVTVQALLSRADELANAMPHDISPTDSAVLPSMDRSRVDLRELQCLWHHFARIRGPAQLALRSLNSPIPSTRSVDTDIGLPHIMRPSPHEPIDQTLSSLDLLDLLQAAHPSKFPLWWHARKRASIEQGRPDEKVPPAARPRSSRTTRTPGGTGDEVSGGTGGAEGAGGPAGYGVGSGGHGGDGAGNGDEAGGYDGSRSQGHAASEGRDGSGREDRNASGGDAYGQFDSGPAGECPCVRQHLALVSTFPDTHTVPVNPPVGEREFYAHNLLTLVLDTTPPPSDDDEAGREWHRAHWLRQQHAQQVGMAGTTPATPETLPVRPTSLYAAHEISRTTPLHAPGGGEGLDVDLDTSLSSSRSDSELDPHILQCLAQLTLDGWRVRLTSPGTFDSISA